LSRRLFYRSRDSVQDCASERIDIDTAQGDEVFVLKQNVDKVAVDVRLEFSFPVEG